VTTNDRNPHLVTLLYAQIAYKVASGEI